MKRILKLMMAVVLAATLILPVSAEKRYTVTVDLGEGTFSDGSHKKTANVKEGEILIDQPGFSGKGGPAYGEPNGYALIGFSLSGETEIAFNVSEYLELKPNRDMELYARYGKRIDVTFDYNGGKGAGEETIGGAWSVVGAGIIGYMPDKPKSDNDNEVFAGWSTSKNGEPEYTHKEMYTLDITSDTTFYAIYKPSVTLTLDGNGGKDYYGDTRTYKVPKGYPFEEYVSPFNPPSSDKVFIGWSKTKDGSVDYETLDNAVFNEDTTLYAVYKEVISLISYDIPEEITMNVGDEIEVPITVNPANAHYTFSIVSHDASVARAFYSSNRIMARREGVAEITYHISYANNNEHHVFAGTIKVTVKMPYLDRAFLGIGDKQYWYENSVRQGMLNDTKNIMGDGTPRGREIYDPASDGWYWLDAIYDGAKAEGKEVWVPYVYQDESKWDDAEIRMNADHADEGMKEYTYQCMKNKTGKWVRYDENGKMLKGWVKIENELARLYPGQAGNTYYYDHYTGLMAKGRLRIGGVDHYFDEITGVMVY